MEKKVVSNFLQEDTVPFFSSGLLRRWIFWRIDAI